MLEIYTLQRAERWKRAVLGHKDTTVLISSNLGSAQPRKTFLREDTTGPSCRALAYMGGSGGGHPAWNSSLLRFPGAEFLAFGDILTVGSRSRDPRHLAPSPKSHAKQTGVMQLTEALRGERLAEVPSGKVPDDCFRKDPEFPGHHGNLEVPPNILNKGVPRGHLHNLLHGLRPETHFCLSFLTFWSLLRGFKRAWVLKLPLFLNRGENGGLVPAGFRS
nr:uncharacterized protein LOC101028200 [Saimiri boliviensis boliviensis]